VPPEEDAASGKSQRQDGVSAPNYRGYFFALERGIMPTKINGHAYDEQILAAAETSQSYEKTYKQVQAEIAAEKDPKRRNALAYDNWMRSRRSGSYSHYEVQQQRELHDVAHIANDLVVCTCGLITDVVYNWENSDDEAFRNAPGHINTLTREPVTLFIVKVHISKELGSENHYWCQNCGDIGNTIPTKAGNISLVGLRAIRSSHKCQEVK
jgi:hypothetical protein